MTKKCIVTIAATAALVVVTAGAATTSASAGGYGYNNGYGGGYGGGYNYGYQQQYDAPRRDDRWQQHVSWCYDRFDSYNAQDNTYQPYNGPRQQCWSPYYRG